MVAMPVAQTLQRSVKAGGNQTSRVFRDSSMSWPFELRQDSGMPDFDEIADELYVCRPTSSPLPARATRRRPR